mgnify:CR=1 FL=1
MTTKEKILKELTDLMEINFPPTHTFDLIKDKVIQSLDRIYNSAIEDCLKALPKEVKEETIIEGLEHFSPFTRGFNSATSQVKEFINQLKNKEK